MTNKSTLEQHLQQGMFFFKNKDYLNAILSFTKVLQFRGSHRESERGDEIPYDKVYLYRAFAWFERGEHDIAAMDIDDALRETPCNAALYNARGKMRRESSQYGKAIRDFTLAIEFDPQNCNHYYERSIVHFKESDLTAAMQDIETAIRLAGNFAVHDFPEFFIRRAEIFSLLGEYERALEDCKIVQNIDEAPADAFRVCADIHLTMGNYIQAHEMFDEAVKRDPELKELDLSLAKCHHAKQEFERTVFYCNRYLESFPHSHEAYQLRGDSYYRASGKKSH